MFIRVKSWVARSAASLVVATTMLIVANSAQAGFTTSFGVTNHFVDQSGWNVGDAGSTHQVWDAKIAATNNTPDRTYNTAGKSLTNSTHSTTGIRTGSSNFYGFSGDFGIDAVIGNHSGDATGKGTHVIIQTGASLRPRGESPFDWPNDYYGVQTNTIKITEVDGTALTGGANGDLLQSAVRSELKGISSSFGPVNYRERFFEFWLPEYTGDFKISWTQEVHASFDVLRVDTMIADAPGGDSPFALTQVSQVPEPGSLLLCSLAGVGMTLVRRRRNRS